MRRPLVIPALVAGLAIAGPAHATAGLFCQARGGGPSVSLVITRGVPGGIFAATLDDGKESRSTGDDMPLVLAQAWIDEKQILVDIADKDLTEYVAKLRAKPLRDEGAVGTLEVGGRKYAVRCEETG